MNDMTKVTKGNGFFQVDFYGDHREGRWDVIGAAWVDAEVTNPRAARALVVLSDSIRGRIAEGDVNDWAGEALEAVAAFKAGKA